MSGYPFLSDLEAPSKESELRQEIDRLRAEIDRLLVPRSNGKGAEHLTGIVGKCAAISPDKGRIIVLLETDDGKLFNVDLPTTERLKIGDTLRLEVYRDRNRSNPNPDPA